MMRLWQYIAIALLVSLKSGRCHKPLSFTSAHFSISAYFLTVQTYKRMRLTTRLYGTHTQFLSFKLKDFSVLNLA